ncbi:MAG TPA: DNA polymerase I [Firmicutes bacterium]|nr:DNA polymerase I [Bacillota bacterium]
MNRIKIIDGNSLLFRSFYATYNPSMDKSAIMHTKNGIPVNAVYIFHKFIKNLRQDLLPNERIVVCFDTGKKTFRSAMLESYKKQRKPVEPELVAQMAIAREMLDSMGIFRCEMDGYEADDIAGSLANFAKQRGDEVILYTSDKDYFQLIDDNVSVHFLRKGLSEVEIYDKGNLLEKFGVRPDQICDYKGLCGDTSDNFKGIPGVGEKTAIKLLASYDHLEDIIEAMINVNTKTAMNIVEHQEDGRFCKKLAQMVLNLDVEKFYLDGQVKPYDHNQLVAFYKKYEFNKFLNELEKQESLFDSVDLSINENRGSIPLGFKKIDYGEVKTVKSISEINDKNFVSFVFSYEKHNYHIEKVKGLFLATKINTYFIADEDIASCGIASFFLDEKNEYITLDNKCLIYIFSRYGIEVKAKCTFDLMLATYLLDTNVEDDASSILKSYEYPLSDDKDIYLSACESLLALKSVALKRLEEENQTRLYYDIELPLAIVLAKMEIRGVPLDLNTLAIYSDELHRKLEGLKEEILSYADHEINLNSPRQVSTFLFEELKLRKPDKKGSTSNENLLKIKDEHPVISLLIEYRKYSKLISSYTDALPNNIYEDHKLHAIFNQALTTTGRLSMSDPNLQNISIRDAEGKEIRKAFFYPNNEYMFLSFDYSQIELRLLAHLSKDKNLIEVFNSDGDIHSTTASKLFGVPKENITPLQRRMAKIVNFSIVYGTTSFGLSEKLDVSVGEAKNIIDAFYLAFPKVKEYEESVIKFVQEHGYCLTMMNRRRYLKDINSSNYMLREFSKRAAVNASIQGSAADLIKKAMIEVEDALRGYQSEMILQIHDELVFKVKREELEMVKKIVKEKMENTFNLSVPLLVEGAEGNTWFEAK